MHDTRYTHICIICCCEQWEEAWERKQSSFIPDPSTSSSEKPTPAVFDFPPSDLTLPLLALYFHHTNVIFPLFHAPTFWAQFRDKLHLRDAQFAGVVWAAMAIASRWSDDRRVLWDGWGSEKSEGLPKVEETAEEPEWASAGWRFFLRSLGEYFSRPQGRFSCLFSFPG